MLLKIIFIIAFKIFKLAFKKNPIFELLYSLSLTSKSKILILNLFFIA